MDPLLATLTGAFTFGNIAPNFQAFSTGIAATGKILATVDGSSGDSLDTVARIFPVAAIPVENAWKLGAMLPPMD
jgi:hypothetical protein